MEDMITVSQAANEWGLHKTTLHRWIISGRLRAVAVKGAHRIVMYLVDPNEVAAMADALAAYHCRRKPPGA